MLVLSRKLGEKIHIGENITVEVRRVAGNRVALAIDAPKEIRILRGELKEATEAFEEPIVADAIALDPAVPGPIVMGPAEDYFVTHHRVSAADSPSPAV